MNELNPYITRQCVLINKLMQQELVGFTTGINNRQADWDDVAFKFTYPNGRTINLYCLNNTVGIYHQSTVKNYSLSQVLPKELRHLIIAFAIDTIAGKNSPHKVKDKVAKAREFLSVLNDNPSNLTQSSLDSTLDKLNNTVILGAFFKWLHKQKLIPSSIQLPPAKYREMPSGSDTVDRRKAKIPDTKLLLALGAIFHDEIPSERIKWNTHSTANQRNAFSSAMAAIAMASPNRAVAEQTILEKQRLKTRSEKVNGKEEVIHYLDWKGSKGFVNNRKHFLGVMSESVDRSLEYMAVVCEPARVLARFYENTLLPLNIVLGEFTPSLANMNALDPDMNKPITLIHLGYLLGFYDNGDGNIRVSQNTKGSEKIVTGNCGKYKTYLKKIPDLKPEDELMIVQSCPYNKYLHGVQLKKGAMQMIHSNGNDDSIKVITVSQFQNFMVKYAVSQLQGFPIGLNNSSNGKCKYKNALFAFTDNQLVRRKNGVGRGHHYLIVSLSSLGVLFTKDLKGGDNTIFSDYGFAPEFEMTPHPLRHWHNDIAERQGVPHALINLWSGRKDPNQIMHYIHRTNAEKSSEIADIFYPESNEDISIKAIGRDQFEKATKTATTVTNVGICTQNLSESPCTYLNDFFTQCTLCPSSCHIAHDKKSLELLKRDLVAQESRLNIVQAKPQFCQREGLQRWFTTHYHNTNMLRELIAVMEDAEIKVGSIIRILSHKNMIRITDVERRIITERKFALPNAESALTEAIEFKSFDEDSGITDFMSDLF
ncbi:hypothetical protein [Photobacterium sp. Alg240-V54]|uniref:hypothetical protein n=1 Tax=Photobacterium sp. Alg240-V54 TaxID=2305995 RepID=UPI0013D7E22F|nr:hypothetical protein [Photobacterium sp. Alg240-V54]